MESKSRYEELTEDIKINENKLIEIEKKINKEEKKAKVCIWGMAISALISVAALVLTITIPGLSSLLIPVAVASGIPVCACYVNNEKFCKSADKKRILYNSTLEYTNSLIEKKCLVENMENIYYWNQNTDEYTSQEGFSMQTVEKQIENKEEKTREKIG